MLKNNRFFQIGSKGVVEYNNEKYIGSKASFNSYIEGFAKFKLEDDDDEEKSEERVTIHEKSLGSKSYKKVDNFEKPKSSKIPSKTEKVSQTALQTLRQLGKGNNLEKFLESHGLTTSVGGTKQLKDAFDKFLSKEEENNETSKWATQLEDLNSLRDENELRKWLESRGVPAANVSVPAVQKELEKYFQNYEPVGKTRNDIRPKIGQPNWGNRSEQNGKSDKKSFEVSEEKEKTKNVPGSKMRELLESEDFLNIDTIVPETRKVIKIGRDFGPCMKLEEFNGRSILLQEDTLANKVWEEFKGMSAPKQIAVVVGITVVTAALGFVSWRILLLAFPTAFQVNHYWGEVLAQWFIQRQESTFHLLQHTAMNAKPLSTAWANQYLLWKYI